MEMETRERPRLPVSAPRKVFELEDAAEKLAERLDEAGQEPLTEFELGLLAGKLAALRWALGASSRISL